MTTGTTFVDGSTVLNAAYMNNVNSFIYSGTIIPASDFASQTGLTVNNGTSLIGRTLTGTTNEIVVTNGNGISGNPTISISGSYVGSASIVTVGTVTTGTWNASLITGQYGGTGVANTGKTITLGGNISTAEAFSTAGANALTLTTTGATNVTLPTSGTLVNDAVTTLSSLVSVGTITTGTWNGSIVTGTYGGTGVNNGASTITYGGNVTFSGAFTTTFTVTGNTSVTLPTSGTLVNDAVTTLSSLVSVGTITTGTWSATTVAVNKGGTGQTSYTDGQLLIGNSTGNTLTKATLTAGSNITITNGGGSITIASSAGGGTITDTTAIAQDNGDNTKKWAVQCSGITTATTRTWTIPNCDKVCSVIQRVSSFTGAVATGTTVQVRDDTIPQNTEGDQYMSLSITPKSTSNILVIEWITFSACSVAATAMSSLFQDTTANALSAVMGKASTSANDIVTLSGRHVMSAGTTSSTTFKVRLGYDSAGTTTFNGSGGARLVGGVAGSGIIITEYSA